MRQKLLIYLRGRRWGNRLVAALAAPILPFAFLWVYRGQLASSYGVLWRSFRQGTPVQ